MRTETRKEEHVIVKERTVYIADDGKEFNIMNGFDDYIKIEKLTGDNQYYCNY